MVFSSYRGHIYFSLITCHSCDEIVLQLNGYNVVTVNNENYWTMYFSSEKTNNFCKMLTTGEKTNLNGNKYLNHLQVFWTFSIKIKFLFVFIFICFWKLTGHYDRVLDTRICSIATQRYPRLGIIIC